MSFDSNSTLFATVEHFMSAFACDLVKIVSVSDQSARDVALHLTASRGEDQFPPPTFPFSLEISGASPSRREVIIYIYILTRSHITFFNSSALNAHLILAG